MNQQNVKKRNRPTLVCLNCRRRKTKCDRIKPACGNCLKLQDICIYSDSVEERQQKQGKYEYVEDFGLDEFIDMAPNGLKLLSKRSASWFNGLFSDFAIKDRDPYLKILDELITLLNNTVCRATDGNAKDLVLKLPESIKIVTTYNRTEPAEDPLYYKISKEISNLRSAPVVDIHIPNEFEFWTNHYPYFEEKIHPLMPVFNLPQLKHTLETFFIGQKKNPGTLNSKMHDHDTLTLVYLIINFYLMEFNPHSTIIQKHINLIKNKLFEFKWFQKTTLFQLRVWLIFRLHNWCTFHDNDGNLLNANDGLMGLIMGQCNSLGINWQLWKNVEREDCKSIWVNALYWDRKLAILKGTDPLNTRTMRIPELPNDSLILKLLSCCIDDPNHLNYTVAMDALDKIDFGDEMPMVQWEWKVIRKTTKLVIEHGRLVSTNEGMEGIVNIIDELILIWNQHFTKPLSPVAYSNRIVEISMNKVLIILPAIIFRSTSPWRRLVLDTMDKISTTYFNEFPYYYHVFKRLFRYKLMFRLVNKENSLGNILNILKQENIDVLKQLGVISTDNGVINEDVSKVWNAKYKFNTGSIVFKSEMQCKVYESSLFSTSYQHAIEKLEKQHSPNETVDITEFLQDVLDPSDFDIFDGMDNERAARPEVLF